MNKEEKTSFIRLKISLIRHPAKTFKMIKEKPVIWIPILLRLITVSISGAIAAPLAIQFAEEQMVGGNGVNAAQMEQARIFMESPLFTVIGIFSALVATSLVWLIMSAIFSLFGSMWGKKQNFKVALSMVALAWLPLVMHDVLSSITMLITGNIVRPGLSALLPAQAQPGMSVLSVVLQYIDVFSIWSIILLIIGISTIYELSRKKSAFIVLGYMGVIIFIGASMALISSMTIRP